MKLPTAQALSQIRGVVFDLDDTLVASGLDFVAIRKAVGGPVEMGIIEYIDTLTGAARERAEATLRAAEWQGAKQATWMPHAATLVGELGSRGLPQAILTRNARDISQAMISRLAIPIETLVAREDCQPKPNPEGLLMIAEQWQIPPQHMVYIGDHSYDIEAALAANMVACLFIPEHKKDRYPTDSRAHRVVDDLRALLGMGLEIGRAHV